MGPGNQRKTMEDNVQIQFIATKFCQTDARRLRKTT